MHVLWGGTPVQQRFLQNVACAQVCMLSIVLNLPSYSLSSQPACRLPRLSNTISSDHGVTHVIMGCRGPIHENDIVTFLPAIVEVKLQTENTPQWLEAMVASGVHGVHQRAASVLLLRHLLASFCELSLRQCEISHLKDGHVDHYTYIHTYIVCAAQGQAS